MGAASSYKFGNTYTWQVSAFYMPAPGVWRHGFSTYDFAESNLRDMVKKIFAEKDFDRSTPVLLFRNCDHAFTRGCVLPGLDLLVRVVRMGPRGGVVTVVAA